MKTKSEIRALHRKQMPVWLAAHPEAAEAITQHILDLNWPQEHIVGTYWALTQEIPTLPLLTALHAKGHRLALPCVETDESPLRFHEWIYNTDAANDYGLVPDAHNVLSPPASAPELFPDIVLAPVMAFDKTGMRMGKGGGHYDNAVLNLMREKRVLYVGIALDEQLTLDLLPFEPHDVPLNLVITPKGVITPNA
jgi:5-formyltetrahydrofolate cyclo-ligase